LSLEVILVIVAVGVAAAAVGYFIARRSAAPPPAWPPALDPRVEQALQALPGLQQELGGLKQSIARLPSNDVVTALRDRVGRMEGRLPDDLGRGTAIWEPLGWRSGLFDREGTVTGLMSVYDSLNARYLPASTR